MIFPTTLTSKWTEDSKQTLMSESQKSFDSTILIADFGSIPETQIILYICDTIQNAEKN